MHGSLYKTFFFLPPQKEVCLFTFNRLIQPVGVRLTSPPNVTAIDLSVVLCHNRLELGEAVEETQTRNPKVLSVVRAQRILLLPDL